MRRRLLLSMVLVTLLAVIGEGVPRLFLYRRLTSSTAQIRLERDLGRVALVVQRSSRSGTVPTKSTLYRYIGTDDRLTVAAPGSARLVIGGDPGRDRLAARVVTPEGAHLILERGRSGIDDSNRESVGVLALTTAAGVILAVLVALVLTRALSRPLERLSRSARRLESGDVPAPVPRSGIAEIDAVAEGLEAGATRIAGLLQSEREFSSNANHQMRSALTGLSLSLEELGQSQDPEVQAAAGEALEQVARIEHTVEELLLLARTGRAGEQRSVDLADLVADHVADARRVADPQRRPIRLDVRTGIRVVVVPGAVGQALDILLANALEHGAGAVTVAVASTDGTAEVWVSDEGPGVAPGRVPELFRRSPGGLHGIGLSLARSLVESEGGTLDVADPATARFRLALPCQPAAGLSSQGKDYL